MEQHTMDIDVVRIKRTYGNLLRLCRSFIKPEEMVQLRKAFELVLQFHQEKWRESEEDYLYHSLEVSRIVLVELNLGFPSLMSALLHNLVDDGKLSIPEVSQLFGDEIAVILDGYHKLTEINTEKISANSDKFRTLFMVLVKDIRVILIKLAHRIFDMRHFDLLTSEKQERFLQEVNHIYIPIAHRLGLYQTKTELEELWMKYTHGAIFDEISNKIVDTRAKRKVFIDDFVAPIEKELIKQNIEFTIKGRLKSIYSIWRKMENQNVDFEQVYDLLAIRIIIDSPPETEKGDCWRVYSVVSDIYTPKPERLRDWISTPKASGYESLHTTVMDLNKKWIEVQIRSERMDVIAEKGMAAHWKYKEGAAQQEQEEWLTRIREIVEKSDSKEKVIENLSTIKMASDKVIIFTPEGDLKKLKMGATVLDFAYEIHSNVGDTCSGARVNGRIVSLKHQLSNGDKVEIMTSKNQKPKLDWLNFAVTSKAKSKIKRSLKEAKFREAEMGKEILMRKLRNRKIPFNDTVVDKLIKYHKLNSSVDLYYMVAIEKIGLSNLRELLSDKSTVSLPTQEFNTEPSVTSRPTGKTDKDFIVIDKEINNLDFELARCCNPISGDPVFGFVTVQKGITIHRSNCPNAKQLKEKFNYRVIDAKWLTTDENKTYLTTLQVTGKDEVGILNNITQVISSDFNVNMVSLNVESSPTTTFNARFKLKVKDTNHLLQLIHKIKKVSGVQKVQRILTEK